MKRSMTEIISEEEFLERVQLHGRNFFIIYNYLKKERPPYPRKFYAHLLEESEEFESFLDDHCARDNKRWYLFGELVACVRNISKVAFTLTHIVNRYATYGIDEEENDLFLDDAARISKYLDELLLSLYNAIELEGAGLGIAFPEGTIRGDSFGELYPKKRLPHTIDEEEEEADASRIITNIATQYIKAAERFERLGWHAQKDQKDTSGSIPEDISEEKARELTAFIHNLQSTYDHYVKHTPLESRDESLKRLRGYISMALHLLTIVDWLSHLYQRHLRSREPAKGDRKLSDIIDNQRVLEIITGFAVPYCALYFRKGSKLAHEILWSYLDVTSCELNIPVGLGFHLRPATLVAKMANHYGTKLSLIVDGQEYDASSVFSMTMAAGLIARKGYKKVTFKGDARLLKDLKLLAEYNYGEDEKGRQSALPPELSYLFS